MAKRTFQEVMVKALREYLSTIKDTEGTSATMAKLQPDYKALLALRDQQIQELQGILLENSGKLNGLLGTLQEIDSAVADVAFVHGYRRGDLEGREAEDNLSQSPLDCLLETLSDDDGLFGNEEVA